jgi:hypothetical protein
VFKALKDGRNPIALATVSINSCVVSISAQFIRTANIRLDKSLTKFVQQTFSYQRKYVYERKRKKERKKEREQDVNGEKCERGSYPKLNFFRRVVLLLPLGPVKNIAPYNLNDHFIRPTHNHKQ